MSAPSGYTALDFVGFTDKGTYSPIVKYMRNDLVHYGGNIMRCKVDDTMNVTPVEGANWEIWVGASANLVERVIAPLENNPADVAFGVGRQIIYDDWLWEVIAPIAVGDALIDYAVDPTNANIKKSAPVETQLLAVKAEADATDNMIAPTEANASSSSAPYSVGDQLILNNILYDVIAAIQIGDALTTGTGGNIAAADTLTDQLAAKANRSELAPINSSIQTLTNNDDAMLNVLGAKNLLQNNMPITQVDHLVTLTVNSDNSVSTNGTSDGNVGIKVNGDIPIDLPSGRYVLSGCPVGGAVETYCLALFNGNTLLGYDKGDGLEFEKTNQTDLKVYITIKSGVTAPSNNWYPMIRPASVADDTYVPYAMTNRKLTNALINSPLHTKYQAFSVGTTRVKLAEFSVTGLCKVTAIYDFNNTTSGEQEIRINVDGNEYAGNIREARQGLMTLTAVCNPTSKIEVYVKASASESDRPFRCIVTR